jgi:hypothetical protein
VKDFQDVFGLLTIFGEAVESHADKEPPNAELDDDPTEVVDQEVF